MGSSERRTTRIHYYATAAQMHMLEAKLKDSSHDVTLLCLLSAATKVAMTLLEDFWLI